MFLNENRKEISVKIVFLPLDMDTREVVTRVFLCKIIGMLTRVTCKDMLRRDV